MKFTVKTLDGKSQDFDLLGDVLVGELKKKVEASLGVPVAEQRMLSHGKLMKDHLQIQTYDIEGKIIHVVKSAPSLHKSAPSPRVPPNMLPEKLSNEYMYIGVVPETLPLLPGVIDIQDLAKDSASNILTSVTDGNHSEALVTVTIHTLTPDGRPIQSSTHTCSSYKPGDACMRGPPDPKTVENELHQKKEQEEQRQASIDRLSRYRERVREQQRRGREQTNILEIYQHMTSVRRAIQGAENILEGYLNSSEYKEAKEVLEHHMKLKADYEAKIAAEKDSGASGKDSTTGESDSAPASTEEQSTSGAATRKDAPQYAMGEDGRPRQHILTDTGMLLPAGAHLYAALIDDIISLQRRGLELHEFYARKIYAEEHYEPDDSRLNSKLVTAVHRFHNAMGQAYASIKKVQVTLDGEPPRIVSLAPGARSTNPLLSLLSQPLGGESESSIGHGGSQGEEGSLAGLLGSLMATRAAMRMMENEEEQQQSTVQQQEGTTSASEGATGEGTASSESSQVAQQSSRPAQDDDDDDDINPFLPGPVHLLQQMMKQKQERERQKQQERTVVIQPHQPFFEVIARIRQAVGGPEEEIMPPTLIGNLVERCMRKMSISEVVTVFGGVTGPLKTIHPTLRDFVKERLLNGEEPTADKIPLAISNFVQGLPEVLKGFDPPLPLREDVDFGASAQNCCSYMLEEVMDLVINRPDDDEEFPQLLYDWAMKMGTLFTLLLRECLLSSNDLEPSMKRLSKMMFPDNDTPGVLSMLNSQSLVEKFIGESEKSTITLEEIHRHIVVIGDQDMEVDATEDDKKGDEVTQVWPEAMPKEWIPTIQNDQVEMEKMHVQPPLSTAYLSSVPAKKRKLESGDKDSVHVSEILGEALESAIDTAGSTTKSGATSDDVINEAKADDTLVQAMGEEFHAAIQDRLQSDPDYDPAKYPSAQKFYQPKQ